jgi:hypothetical protein
VCVLRTSATRRGRHDGGRARHAGGQPFPADLVGQALRLRGLQQASLLGAAVRQVQGSSLLLQGLPGVLTTTQLALSRPLAQETGMHASDTRTA